MKKVAMIEAFTKYQAKIEEASAVYQAALFNDNCDFSAALTTFEAAGKNAMEAYEKDVKEVKKAVALAALLSASDTVTPVTPAPDRLLAAENSAWDDYEDALAAVQEMQDALVTAGSSVLQAYNAMQWRRNAACNALDSALATASAEYGITKKIRKNTNNACT